MIPAIPPREVHDLLPASRRGYRGHRQEAGAIKRQSVRQSPAAQVAVAAMTLEGGDVIGIEGIQGTSQRIIIELGGFDQHGCQESRGRFILEKPWTT